MATSFTVSKLTSNSPTKPLHELYESTLGLVSPYSLPSNKFHSLLTAPQSQIFIATSTSSPTSSSPILGFALTYLIRAGSASNKSLQHYKGAIALLIVHPSHRNHGIGSALHAAALEHLTQSVRSSFNNSYPKPTSSQIQLGSTFPRIWPGVPNGPEFDEAKLWFQRRGWVFKDECSIDLYRSLDDSVVEELSLNEMVKKAEGHEITFGCPEAKDIQGLLELQKEEFDTYTGWPDMFPALLDAGQSQDIWCAFDKSGQVIGATVAALEPDGPMLEVLAWPATIGKRCASIACVGISSKSRGTGAGVALVASATMNLARRGADGCFIDWVSLKGFYQRCGYEPWAKGYWEAWRDVNEV
ncbi:hypothetical protein BCR39DRAFT_548233 [Naematelia encephala]|uniref:N-acetyltransferase domain-containing protein n=1 Tax=Naematelia encephala TaxID=71784 RepID=A0A1Y2AN29_9TREE|nr:hypothetical protein BCR39DRAFT_548233 [Naematelia encephala]